jgi:putative MFS transporter
MIVPVIYNAYGEKTGYGYILALLTGVFAVVAVVVALFGKETMGKSLEEISG